MAGFSVWKSNQANDIFRVANDCCSRVHSGTSTSDPVVQIDLYFAGQATPILANTLELRLWLISIPIVV